jgi:hypothetical protein
VLCGGGQKRPVSSPAVAGTATVIGGGQVRSGMNLIVLQEAAGSALPIGATGAAVLVASLLVTAAWLLSLGR